MKPAALREMSVDQLVARFTAIALEQDEAELAEERHRYAPLFRDMQAIVQELKQRPGDQRHALLRLYEHPNMQVRLKAAKNTLAVARKPAEEMLKAIRESHWYPQAGEAGIRMTRFADACHCRQLSQKNA